MNISFKIITKPNYSGLFINIWNQSCIKRFIFIDDATLRKLEDGYTKLAASNSQSLLRKYLTQNIFEKLKKLKTPIFGSSLWDCIQSGILNLDSNIGVYAGDNDAYKVFADIFNPIINDYHVGFDKQFHHPAPDFGIANTFGNLDPSGKLILSTRIRCARSIEGFPFNPNLSEEKYVKIENKTLATLEGLTGDLQGKYYRLKNMSQAIKRELIEKHILFKEGDRFLQAANACRYWPVGRGIFLSHDRTFSVWCNEEDHLRIISMQTGGDLGQVYARLVRAVNAIGSHIPFCHNDRLGYLTFCPTNLGTAIRASVHIKLSKLSKRKSQLDDLANANYLQVRGTDGEHTPAVEGVYDISNKRRLGITEYQAVKEMHDGVLEIIKIEDRL